MPKSTTTTKIQLNDMIADLIEWSTSDVPMTYMSEWGDDYFYGLGGGWEEDSFLELPSVSDKAKIVKAIKQHKDFTYFLDQWVTKMADAIVEGVEAEESEQEARKREREEEEREEAEYAKELEQQRKAREREEAATKKAQLKKQKAQESFLSTLTPEQKSQFQKAYDQELS